MSKFMMKMKLQGFEIEIQGDRADAPRIANTIGQRLGAIIAPVAESIGVEAAEAVAAPQPALHLDTGAEGKVRRKRSSRSPRAAASGDVEPIAWRHDFDRFGSPQQSWTTAKKAIWLLHAIASQVEGRNAVDSATLTATFNSHFKEAGMIMLGNLNRDLAREKGKSVGQDTTVNPPTWYLTQAGKRVATELIEAARAPVDGSKNGLGG